MDLGFCVNLHGHVYVCVCVFTRVYCTYLLLQVSDDEDDTHPNVDTPSLFRWRHQARVDRMEETKEEKDQLKTEEKEYIIFIYGDIRHNYFPADFRSEQLISRGRLKSCLS